MISDTKRIAFCGLYCGACRKFLSGNVPGARKTGKPHGVKYARVVWQMDSTLVPDVHVT